jgi:transcriptional regulator with XRE-family HTH domain
MPKNPPETFPAILTRLRTAAGLSIPALARASGLSDDVLRQYETPAGEPRHRSPSWESVQKIAKALAVPTDAFREHK